jgi:hypothetical protein
LANSNQFTHYYAFCAIAVLYVDTIQRRSDPHDSWRPSFQAAEKCQAQLSSFVAENSFAQRYGIVLEELRLEVVKQTQRGQSSHLAVDTDPPRNRWQPQETQLPNADLQSSVIGQKTLAVPLLNPTSLDLGDTNATAANLSLDDPATYEQAPVPLDISQFQVSETALDAQQSTFMAEMTGWGEFDSLVSRSWLFH